MEIELPPRVFSNLMNDIDPDFDYRFWKLSNEWRIFKAGKLHGLADAIDKIQGISLEK